MRVVEAWPEYVRRVAKGLTQAQIANKAGVSTSNVGRWLRAEPGQPGADNVIAFAKAFQRDPVEALTAAGYFNAGDHPRGRTPLSQYSTEELFEELRGRVGG